MNVYDPADYIVYVTMDRVLTPSLGTGAPDLVANRLPSGYANGSPRTRLRGRTAGRPQAAQQLPVPPHAPVSSLPEQAGPRRVHGVA